MIVSVQTLSRAYPFGLEKRLHKNDRQVVTARKRELASYCTSILQLAARLGSLQTDLAVQRFLRRSGGGVQYRWADLPNLLEGTAVRSSHLHAIFDNSFVQRFKIDLDKWMIRLYRVLTNLCIQCTE